MIIKGIIYERLFPLGPYENERITLQADVDETENPIEVFKDMKATVFQLHEEGKLLEESKKAVESEKTKPQYDLSKIKTERTEGPSGFYQKATEQDSEDYKLLIEDLKRHDNKLTRSGFWIWLFSDGKTVGMKPSKK